MWLCQVGLALTQAAFALGAVYYKYSLNENEGSEEGFHPIVFAFTREVVAGTVMCFLAFCFTGKQLPTMVLIQAEQYGFDAAGILACTEETYTKYKVFCVCIYMELFYNPTEKSLFNPKVPNQRELICQA